MDGGRRCWIGGQAIIRGCGGREPSWHPLPLSGERLDEEMEERESGGRIVDVRERQGRAGRQRLPACRLHNSAV